METKPLETKTSGTLIDAAYEHLWNKLMNGDIKPGTMLSENDIAAELGMSRTPVRIAISRLESDGIVQSLRKRGVFVKEVSYRESYEIVEITLAMQLYAAAYIEQEGFHRLDELRGHYARQKEATERTDYMGYIQASSDFTYCYLSAARNESMMNSLRALQSKSMLFAVMNYRLTPNAPHFSATPFNGSILRAVEESDWPTLRGVLLQMSDKIRERKSFY